MTVRALMVDVDGVVVRHPEGVRWQDGLARDLGVEPAALRSEFFRPHFGELLLGHGDVRAVMAEVLARIAPSTSADDLLSYWFAHDAALDRALLADLATLRATGVELHLATNQEARRADHLWRVLGLGERFDAMHASHRIGAIKPSPDYFAAVERRTGFAPHELLLVDDATENVDAARRAGWAAHLWTPASTLADLPLG